VKSLVKGKRKEVKAECEASKRSRAERRCDFINDRILDMAQVFAPPRFEFLESPASIPDAIAPIPSMQTQASVEILSVSKGEDVEGADLVLL
jgi:hypothetical protein